ncbi:MAG: site-specific DNA-methyltransferase, partial [Riemerella sp.]
KKVLFGEKKEAGIGKIGFIRTGTAESNLRIGRPNSFYAVLVDNNYNVVGIEKPPKINQSYPEENTVDGFIRIYPKSKDGTERVWRRSYESCLKEIENNNIVCSSNFSLSLISDNEESSKPIFSNWTDTKYNAGVHGTNVLTNIIGKPLFSYPKSVFNLYDCINYSTDKDSLILDYFAGSGTTGHATIKLNREDGGSRKYILVEMGGYFDTVTKPRIQKVIYTDSWKDGKPQDREGISQLVKYQVLESYEDALNNLQLPDKSSESLLNFDEQAQEEYLLNYMLDVESRDHLFNIQMFRNPFNYQLKVTENNELVPTKVDLVETFNYLIGLYVERMQRVGDIKFIEGKTREGVKTLVIWRNVETTTNEETAKKFRKIYDSIRSSEFDQIYINGDHHFDNMRTGEDTFKVKLIEETFFKQMFNISEL